MIPKALIVLLVSFGSEMNKAINKVFDKMSAKTIFLVCFFFFFTGKDIHRLINSYHSL